MAITKNSDSEQLCRVGIPGGGVSNPTLTSQAISPLADSFGRLIVVVDGAGGGGSSATIAQVTSEENIESESTHVGLCRIIGIAGFNLAPGAGLLYVQLFDLVVAPVLGNIPQVVIPVPNQDTSFSYSLPFLFTNGLAIGISTTRFTFTPGGANLYYTATFNI